MERSFEAGLDSPYAYPLPLSPSFSTFIDSTPIALFLAAPRKSWVVFKALHTFCAQRPRLHLSPVLLRYFFTYSS
jgi:hypothetical protein